MDVKWCHPKLVVEVRHLAGSKTLRDRKALSQNRDRLRSSKLRDAKKIHNAGARHGSQKEVLFRKSARAGKDVGKRGKNFSKIESKAAKRYGSKEAGKLVAGAALAKLRAKKK